MPDNKYINAQEAASLSAAAVARKAQELEEAVDAIVVKTSGTIRGFASTDGKEVATVRFSSSPSDVILAKGVRKWFEKEGFYVEVEDISGGDRRVRDNAAVALHIYWGTAADKKRTAIGSDDEAR